MIKNIAITVLFVLLVVTNIQQFKTKQHVVSNESTIQNEDSQSASNKANISIIDQLWKKLDGNIDGSNPIDSIRIHYINHKNKIVVLRYPTSQETSGYSIADLKTNTLVETKFSEGIFSLTPEAQLTSTSFLAFDTIKNETGRFVVTDMQGNEIKEVFKIPNQIGDYSIEVNHQLNDKEDQVVVWIRTTTPKGFKRYDVASNGTFVDVTNTY